MDRANLVPGGGCPYRRPAGGVKRRIAGYHRDDEGHWVADLECGHGQHVRHDPPWQTREWVTTPEGRARFLGRTLNCVKCDHQIIDPIETG